MEHELNMNNNWTVEVPVNLNGREIAIATTDDISTIQEQNRTSNNLSHGIRA